MGNNNLFYPLIDNLFKLPLAVYNLTHKLPDYVEYQPKDNIYYGNTILLPMGLNRNNKEVFLELSQSSPITYIVGNTGSGKSTLLRCLLTTIINNYKHVKLVLCDAKLCELSLFKICNNVNFYYTLEDISNAIDSLYDEVIVKYNNLMNSNRYACNIHQETTILIIEEMALLNDKKLQKKLLSLLSICRCTNTYCIFTTQRPSNDVIPPTIKALVSNRIVLRVEDKKNSIIALDQEGAELLKGNGHAILKNANGTCEFRSYYINDNTLLDIINKNKNNVSNTCNTINCGDTSWINRL